MVYCHTGNSRVFSNTEKDTRKMAILDNIGHRLGILRDSEYTIDYRCPRECALSYRHLAVILCPGNHFAGAPVYQANQGNAVTTVYPEQDGGN